ncbi:MAG: DUF362 domain-containing protein [Candidatus Brockarchaeota archaeon]|nr:DUF362 domain-containing protein [Candidatus Brockarchaeota archaeon]
MAKVSVVKVPRKCFDEDVFSSVKHSIELLGGPEAFARHGDKVVVKPNILNVTDVEATDPRIIYAVSKIFTDIGCNVIVGDNPLVGTISSEVFEKMRIREVAERAGARFVDFRRDEQVTVEVPDAKGCPTLRIAKTVMDADLIVSLPVMKHHGLCNVTLGLKNMWGVIGPTQRRLGHLNSLNWTLAELNRILRVRLTIIDGLIGVGYNEASPLGLIIAGDDPVATDAIACFRMGFNPMGIEHIRYAHELGLGEIDPKKIELVGITLEQLVKEGKASRKIFVMPLAKPARLLKRARNVKLVQGNVCSGCEKKLSIAIKKIGIRQIAKGPKMAIVIGRGAKPLDGRINIIIGRCLQEYRDKGIFVGYCPAYDPDIQQAIEVALGKREKITYLWDELEQKMEKGLPGS